MHLGYHELRNMLAKFKEEREKRKNAAPAGPPGAANGGQPPRGGDRDYRSRDETRERDRGYERHGSSRYEFVLLPFFHQLVANTRLSSDRRRERSRSPGQGRRRY